MIKIIENKKEGITAPIGFQSSGISCGLKKNGERDLALIYSDTLASAAGVFTTNQVQAAPVKLSKEIIVNGVAKAIIINSGNANACTGKQGINDAQRMAEIVAQNLNINKEEVLIASTGIIGKNLPMDKIEPGIIKLVSELGNGHTQAAEAILTTDTCKKERDLSFTLPEQGQEINIGGMSKGSGMIHPNMATMLGFITTDLAITPELLQEALQEAVNESFNKISVDGDQSTNDTVFLLANGKAKNKKIEEKNQNFFGFLKALKQVCKFLAKAIIADGEGATKFITINVNNAQTKQQAEEIARKVANSNLVKTACFGSDPNWGRILAAIGSCEIKINVKNLELQINGKLLFKDALPVKISSDQLEGLMDYKEIVIDIDLNSGQQSTIFWTADMSYEYVEINAEYHT